MKKILCGLFLLAGVGLAAPACTTVLSTSVVTLNGGGGCTVGNLTFSSFSVLNGSSGVGTAEVDLVSVTQTGNEIDLFFNPNLGTGTIGGTITDLHFAFLVAGPLSGTDLNGADLTVNGQFASISENICSVYQGVNGGCSAGNTLFNAAATSGQSGSCAGNTASSASVVSVCNFGSGVQSGYVFKDISIGTLNGGHLTSFEESFLTASSVPEPASLSMMGLGLLGLGLIGRRKRKV